MTICSYCERQEAIPNEKHCAPCKANWEEFMSIMILFAIALGLTILMWIAAKLMEIWGTR